MPQTPTHLLRGRDAWLGRLHELAERPDALVVVAYGMSGIGKTDLLRQFHVERTVAGGATSLVELDELRTTSALQVLDALASGLTGPPLLLRPIRFSLVSETLGVVTGETPDLTRGTLKLAAAAADGGTVAMAIDTAWRTAHGVNRAARLARVEAWLRNEVAPDWRTGLADMAPRELSTLLPRALAADVADAGGPHGVVLCIDGLQPDRERPSSVESAVRSLCEELQCVRGKTTVVISSHEPLPWEDKTSATKPTLELQQDPLEELTADAALEVLGDFGVAEMNAQAIVSEVGGFPLALVLAAQWLSEVGSAATAQLTALTEDARQAGDDLIGIRRRVAIGLLGALLFRTDTDLAAFLRAAAVPRFFSATLTYRLHEHDHDRLLARLTERPYVRPIEVPGVEENAWRLHDLVRLGVRETWTAGRQWYELHRRCVEWLDEILGTAAEQPFVLRAARVEHLLVVDPRAALTDGMVLIEEQTVNYGLDRAREVLSLLDGHGWADDDRAELLLRAGRIDLAGVCYREALDRFTSAAALLPEGDAFTPLRVSVLKNLAEANRLAGDNRRALKLFQQLDAFVEEARCDGMDADEAALVTVSRIWVDWGLSLTYKVMDLIEPAMRYADAVQAAVPMLDDQELQAVGKRLGMQGLHTKRADIARHRAELLRCSGNYAGSESCLDEALVQYGPGPGIRQAYGLVTRAQLRRMEGLYDAAETLALEAQRMFESLREPRGTTTALGTVAEAWLAKGMIAEARPLLERLGESGESYPHGPVYAALGLAEAARREGDADAALCWYARADEACRLVGGNIESACALLGLAEAQRALHDVDKAKSAAYRGRKLAARCGYVPVLLQAEVIYAVVTAEDGGEGLDRARNLLSRFCHRPEGRRREEKLVHRVERELTKGAECVDPIFLGFP